MKTKLFLAVLALGLTVATQARAQVIFSSGPIGVVAWGKFVPLCKITSGAGLASINVSGGITFSSTGHGTINLVCDVPAMMRVDPSAINAFGLTFYNDNGFVGGVNQCSVSTTMGAYPYAGGFPTLIGAFNTLNQTFSGRQTANIPLTAFLDVNNNLYLISVSLTRQTGATCNPKVVTTFLEEVIQ